VRGVELVCEQFSRVHTTFEGEGALDMRKCRHDLIMGAVQAVPKGKAAAAPEGTTETHLDVAGTLTQTASRQFQRAGYQQCNTYARCRFRSGVARLSRASRWDAWVKRRTYAPVCARGGAGLVLRGTLQLGTRTKKSQGDAAFAIQKPESLDRVQESTRVCNGNKHLIQRVTHRRRRSVRTSPRTRCKRCAIAATVKLQPCGNIGGGVLSMAPMALRKHNGGTSLRRHASNPCKGHCAS